MQLYERERWQLGTIVSYHVHIWCNYIGCALNVITHLQHSHVEQTNATVSSFINKYKGISLVPPTNPLLITRLPNPRQNELSGKYRLPQLHNPRPPTPVSVSRRLFPEPSFEFHVSRLCIWKSGCPQPLPLPITTTYVIVAVAVDPTEHAMTGIICRFTICRRRFHRLRHRISRH